LKEKTPAGNYTTGMCTLSGHSPVRNDWPWLKRNASVAGGVGMGMLSPSMHNGIITSGMGNFNTNTKRTSATMSRVVAYIDGFNLYYGLREKYGHKYMWLDMRKLVSNLLKPDQKLAKVKYFTALVRDNPEKEKRQRTYLDALKATTEVEIIFGKYKLSDFRCPHCGRSTTSPSEKMTDVNISVSMIRDAVHNRFDTALLITGDSDLTPAVNAISAIAPEKRIVVVFPPRRSAFELRDAADACISIFRTTFARSQLPDEVITESGHVLRRPDKWR